MWVESLELFLQQARDSRTYTNTNYRIPKYIRRCYYSTAVLYGQQDTFDFFSDHHLTEQDTDERFYQWLGMVASKEKENIWK